jgi:enolase
MALPMPCMHVVCGKENAKQNLATLECMIQFRAAARPPGWQLIDFSIFHLAQKYV